MQLNIRMDRQRQVSDIAHPMYEIIDNALSAVDGYTNHYYDNHHTTDYNHVYIILTGLSS